jgi:ATP-binding cassette subfamily B protein
MFRDSAVREVETMSHEEQRPSALVPMMILIRRMTRLMARMLRYLRPYKAAGGRRSLLHTATQLLVSTKVAIDRYIAHQDVAGLDRMALAYLGVVLLGFIFLFVQTYTTEYTGQRAMHDLRLEIFTHLQKQDMAYFDRNPVGRLMTRNINDVETLNELFSTGVVGLLGDLFIVFGIARCCGSIGNWLWFASPLFR